MKEYENLSKELIIESSGRSYELSRSIVQELSFETLILKFKNRKLSLGNTQMKTLKLIGDDGLYTNLAFLLSDECDVTFKVAFFKGRNKEQFRDRKEFTGSLLKQADDIFDVLEVINSTSSTFVGLYRDDSTNYPYFALREALLNAIVHRDYSIQGSNIINIFEDRIEFVSVGGLISSLDLDSIFLGASRSRNPRLADIFYRLGLIESYGIGIGKIMDSYENAYTKPKFETAKGVFRVTLPNMNENDDEYCVSEPSFKYDCQVISDEKKMILDYVSKKGMISRKETEELINCKTTKACRLLKELCMDGKLLQDGNGKLSVYRKK